MGSLRAFNLTLFQCNVFFETGTGTGASLHYAWRHHPFFKKLYSSEIHEGTAAAAASHFKEVESIEILHADSASALRRVLPRVGRKDRILFFLDAHFPGEVSKEEFKGYLAAEPAALKLPLEEELKIIRELRGDCEDVIVIDDLRIYENGPFESGNMPDWAETLDPDEKSIDFVLDLFPGRRLIRDYRNEGYLLILPE